MKLLCGKENIYCSCIFFKNYMRLLFRSHLYFSILYFIVFIVDSYIKANLFYFRYLSKPSLIFLLLIFFLINQRKGHSNKISIIVIALLSFIIGDLLFIGMESKAMMVIGAIFLAVDKILYSIGFSNKKELNIFKLVPFLLFCLHVRFDDACL